MSWLERSLRPAGSPRLDWLAGLSELASQREQAGLRRQLRPRGEADELIDLAGNDYLGLSRRPEVLAAAAKALTGYGLGATASRLVRGSTDVHAALEASLAGLLGCEAALVFSSGYLANLGTVRAVATTVDSSDTGCLIASDAHNHASLVDGCRLVARENVSTVVYSHVDVDGLSTVLGAGAGVVLTESVFSVHGDLAPLAALHAVSQARGAVLVIDDAHGLGVVGPDGGGAVRAAGLCGQSDVVVTATLSKALGAAGGVVAGPRAFIRHLVETSRPFIYDTGLPPSVAAGALAAVSLVASPDGQALRSELVDRASLAFRRLRGEGLAVGEPSAGVLSVSAPGPEEAVAWAAACRSHGVAVGCFRPPSTPDGESRLRLTINVAVPRDDFERALDTIVKTRPATGAGL